MESRVRWFTRVISAEEKVESKRKADDKSGAWVSGVCFGAGNAEDNEDEEEDCEEFSSEGDSHVPISPWSDPHDGSKGSFEGAAHDSSNCSADKCTS